MTSATMWASCGCFETEDMRSDFIVKMVRFISTMFMKDEYSGHPALVYLHLTLFLRHVSVAQKMIYSICLISYHFVVNYSMT